LGGGVLTLFLAVSLFAQSPAKPDPALSPGMYRTTNATEICASTFRTKLYRHTTQATKNQVYREYGVQPNKGRCKGGCEVDHIIPLELGGLDDIRNLWPQPSQPKPGFHEKDKLENYLRKQVCAGKMKLDGAQAWIRTDWYEAYKSMQKVQGVK
jgi:5-methylcytosine-specific restriction endonuclease McrA